MYITRHSHFEKDVVVAKDVNEAFAQHLVEYLNARFGGENEKCWFKLHPTTQKERSEHAKTLLSGELNVYNG